MEGESGYKLNSKHVCIHRMLHNIGIVLAKIDIDEHNTKDR